MTPPPGLTPGETVSAHPRAAEWIALALWPPVCCYGAYVVLGIFFGVPPTPGDPAWGEVLRRALTVGAAASVLVIARSIRMLLTRGYWRLDETGITRGRVGALHIPWSDVESVVLGMPDEQHWYVRTMEKIPTRAIEGSLGVIRAFRERAIVLRLSGRRLFVVSLGRQHVGGAAFMERLAELCADRTASPETYTQAEARALARIRFGRVLDVPDSAD